MPSKVVNTASPRLSQNEMSLYCTCSGIHDNWAVGPEWLIKVQVLVNIV